LGHLSSGLKSQPEMLATAAPSTKLPGVTLDYMASHGVDWWATAEDVPMPDNRVTLHAVRRDHAQLHAEQP
jgi:hypothetical protein